MGKRLKRRGASGRIAFFGLFLIVVVVSFRLVRICRKLGTAVVKQDSAPLETGGEFGVHLPEVS